MKIKQKPKQIIAVIAFVLSFSTPILAEGAGTMYLQPNSMTVNVGTQFSTIVMVDAAGLSLKSATTVINYDNSMLKVLNVDYGTTFQNQDFKTWNASSISISMSNLAAVPSDGELGTIYFEALAGGVTTANFSASSEIIDADNDDVYIQQPGGTYTVNEPAEGPDEGGGGSETGSGGAEGGGSETSGGNETIGNSSTEENGANGNINDANSSGSSQQNNGETEGQDQAAGFSNGESNAEASLNSEKDGDTNLLPYIIGVSGAGLGIAAFIAFDKFKLLNGTKKSKIIDGYNSKSTKIEKDPIEPIPKTKPTTGYMNTSSASDGTRTGDYPLSRLSGQLENSEITSTENNEHKIIDNRSPEEIAEAKKDLAESRKKPGTGTLDAGPGSTLGETKDFPLNRQSG